MTLKSALEDLRQTTLPAISGLLGKLAYLASLRCPPKGYAHWGMESVYGKDSADRALRTAHAEITTRILRTPLALLTEDLDQSSSARGVAAQSLVQQMNEQFDNLLPGERTDAPSRAHLNSVLAALSGLAKHRARATRSAS
jgi:hypothetical protein